MNDSDVEWINEWIRAVISKLDDNTNVFQIPFYQLLLEQLEEMNR